MNPIYPYAAITALCTFLCGCAPETRPSTQGQRLLLVGHSFVEEQRYAEARNAYEQALALDSLDAEAHFAIGNLEANFGRLSTAVAAYRKAIDSDVDHQSARHNLAVIEADRGQLPQAIKLLEYMPDYPPALRTLALFYAKQGHYERAEQTLLAALATGDHVDVREQFGQLYLRQGRHDEARSELERAMALDSTRVESRRLIGLAYVAQGNYGEALAAFEQVVADQPHHIEAHYNLSTVLTALSRPDAAARARKRFEALSGHAAQIARLRRRLDTKPDHLTTRLELAHHYRQLGRPEDALTHYRAAQKIQPAHLETMVQLSALLLDRGAADQVLEICGRGIDRYPDETRTGQLHFTQGLVRLRRGQHREARADFESAVELDPSLATAWNNLGNALLALGETSLARQAIEAAIVADSSLADAHYNLGSLLLQKGQLEPARQAYLLAVYADPSFVRSYYALATVYQARGEIAKARQAYQTFIELWQGDPDFLHQARKKLARL